MDNILNDPDTYVVQDVQYVEPSAKPQLPRKRPRIGLPASDTEPATLHDQNSVDPLSVAPDTPEDDAPDDQEDESDDHWGEWTGQAMTVTDAGHIDEDVTVIGPPPGEDPTQGRYVLVAPGDEPDLQSLQAQNLSGQAGNVPSASTTASEPATTPFLPGGSVLPRIRFQLVTTESGAVKAVPVGSSMLENTGKGKPKRRRIVPDPPQRASKGKGKMIKGGKLRGKWMWLPNSILGVAEAFSGGCTCGFSDEEGNSFSIFLSLLIASVFLMLMYKAYNYCSTKWATPPSIVSSHGRKPSVIECEVCGKTSAGLPYPNCRTCDAKPSYHHGRCCPARVQEEPMTMPSAGNVHLQYVFVCGTSNKHAYHLTEDCPRLKHAKEKIHRCELCKSCEKKAD